jgi:hypothetical protein
MESLRTAQAFRNNIAGHLSQLSRLIRATVQATDLLSLEETETIRQNSKELQYFPSWRQKLEFAEKTSARFQMLVKELGRLNSAGVYLWTPLSNVCGVLRPMPLAAVDWGFDFDLIPEGILVILTADVSDKMLLDFSDTRDGRRELEVEVAGQHWGRARF